MTVAATAIAGLAAVYAHWETAPDVVWLLVLGILFLVERYRLPAGVHTRAEVSVVLTPFIVSMHFVPHAQLVAAAAIAAIAASLSKGRWGESARWEYSAATAAAGSGVLVLEVAHHELGWSIPPAAAAAGVVYAVVRGVLTWIPIWGSTLLVPHPLAFLAISAAQIVVGVTLVQAFTLNVELTLTRVAMLWVAVYLWVFAWYQARGSTIARSTISALPAGALPPLEPLAESFAVVAERELVLPYVRHRNVSPRARPVTLDVHVALLTGAAQCRVYRLAASTDGPSTGRDGIWSTGYPAWVQDVLVSESQIEFGTDTDSGDPYVAVAAGEVAGPAIVVRVPVMEETWPGRRRLHSLAVVYADWISTVLDRYGTAASSGTDDQLRSACDHLVALVASGAAADRVAEQVERVRALAALAVSTPAADLTAAATGDDGCVVGVPAGITRSDREPA